MPVRSPTRVAQGDSVSQSTPSWLISLLRPWRARPAAPLTAFLATACLGIASVGFTASAQESAEDADDEESAEEAVEGDEEVIIVTGSRLKRDTYSSIAPLQVITAEVSREAGLVDAAEIVQSSTASAGQQIDLTFHGFVTDNGPGSVTADLRGLGAGRTLVLINGRRVSPAGVEGAPQSPSLDIIPSLLVSNYDQLLDGASSVYGSDAVAGVVNAVLRKDFDGLQIEAFPRYPHHGAGREDVYSARWGRNFDRGFIGMGVQYSKIEPITLDDRPWTAGCEREYEVDEDGAIRQQNVFWANEYGMEWDDCSIGNLYSRIFILPSGIRNLYYTPGFSNGGWPNFSKATHDDFDGTTIGVDGDGDGRTDISFRDYSLNGSEQYKHLRSARRTVNAMVYGEYTFEGDMNITPYFELLHSNRIGHAVQTNFPIFPEVPASNAFNLCNPDSPDGVDCGLAWDAMFTNPNFLNQYSSEMAPYCESIGVSPAECTPERFGRLLGELGAIPIIPVVLVQGDRTFNNFDITQNRLVLGMRGDLPMLTVGTLEDWSFDISLVHSEASGISNRPGIRQDRLALALGWYSQDYNPCEANIDEAERAARGSRAIGLDVSPLVADSAQGCVPVNMLAPSLYSSVVGDLATPEERAYLFDSRDFDTEYTQSVLSGYLTGTLFHLPSGPVAVGLGVEYRTDDIASIPDQVARDGYLFGFFSDGGAEGDKWTREAFGEVELPLLLGGTPATLNLSARLTDDEFYGSAWTGAVKFGWNPINSLLLRGTYGTSYRAPALRELFLQAQTSFPQLFDPCLIPGAALNADGNYDASLDQRDPIVLRNCLANGVDPTIASNDGFNTYSVEVAAGGTFDLEAETSESMSAGFVWEQPFTNAFDLAIGASYYQIDIRDTIIEPSAAFIINDCYNSATGQSTFCNRIDRDANPERPLINYLRQGFLNRDNETRRGVDVNLTLSKTVRIIDQPVDLEFDFVGHRQIEASQLFTNDQGVVDFDAFQREWYFPEHKAQMGVRATIDRWSISWRSRLHGRIEQEANFVDGFGDANSSNGTFAHTCLGPPDDVLCRDYADAGNYWLHNASARYSGDTWTLRFGASNIFDEAPPQVDATELQDINNTPLGAGYDILGRMYFLGLFVDFGGA